MNLYQSLYQSFLDCRFERSKRCLSLVLVRW